MSEKTQQMIDRLLEMYRAEIQKIDMTGGGQRYEVNRALLALLYEFRTELPAPCEDWYKSFRLTYVTDRPGVDAAIHALMGTADCNLVFECLASVLKNFDVPLRPYTVFIHDPASDGRPLYYHVDMTAAQAKDLGEVSRVVAIERQADIGGTLEAVMGRLEVHLVFGGHLNDVSDYRPRHDGTDL